MAQVSTAPETTERIARFLGCVAVGAALWFSPHPEALNGGWHVLSVFIATIIGFILRPIAMGPLVLIAILVLSATGSFPEGQMSSYEFALSGFGNKTVWLVVAAFLIAGSVIRTGLGRRIALLLIDQMGKTMLGLGYAICGAELILAPFVPSNTARGGGVMAPIVKSLAEALGSRPHERPRRAGDFLVLCGSHANLITAAMFLTAMAANPLVATAAGDVLKVDFGWTMWLKGSALPGLAGLLLLPPFLYVVARPELSDAVAARQQARDELRTLGRWTHSEVITACIFALLLVLWTTKTYHHAPATWVALLGVVLLLITGVQKWTDMAGDYGAWDALVWLGGLLTMATALLDHGVVEWFAKFAESKVMSTSAVVAAVVLALIYFYSMYGFSMLTGHIAAMVAAFFTVALATGTSPLLIIALLAYFSSLCGCLTHYSTGPVIIYFGLGYVSVARWFRIGALVSLFHLAIWLGIGLPYWKWLGWW